MNSKGKKRTSPSIHFLKFFLATTLRSYAHINEFWDTWVTIPVRIKRVMRIFKARSLSDIKKE